MHLCYLTIDAHSSQRGGGLASYLNTLSIALAERGHTVTVLAISKRDHCEKHPVLPLYWAEVACPNWHWYVFKTAFFDRTLALPIREWEWARAFQHGIRLLSERFELPPPDVIEGLELGNWGHESAITNRLIVRAHNSSWITHKVTGQPIPPGLALDRAMERRAISRARYVSSVSEAHAQTLKAEFSESKIALPPITVIPNPIAIEQFPYTPPPPTRTLLYAARLDTWKGILTLLEAMIPVRAAFPDVQLTIVGKRQPGLPIDQFQAGLDRLAGCVTYLDHVQWSEMPKLYQDHALFVIPSLYETFCIAAGEALCSGRAVIGARAGALPELIEDGVTGLLPTPGDTVALAESIKALLGDPQRARVMGERGAAQIRARYSVERVAAESERLYRTLAES